PVDVRLWAEPMANGAVHGLRIGRPLRRRALRSDDLEASRSADRVHRYAPGRSFWGARRGLAFSDDLIRSVVKAGEFTETGAEEYLANVLIKRRNAIGRAYIPAINPIVDPN